MIPWMDEDRFELDDLDYLEASDGFTSAYKPNELDNLAPTTWQPCQVIAPPHPPIHLRPIAAGGFGRRITLHTALIKPYRSPKQKRRPAAFLGRMRAGLDSGMHH